jgi:hypothetical protein
MFGRMAVAMLLAAGISSIPTAANAQCNSCGPDTTSKSCCGFHYTKIVYRHPMFVGGAPPQGVAVASMPAMMIATSTFIPTASVASIAPASTNMSSADVERVAEAIRRQAATAPTTAASSDRECKDPCGDIKQLRKDVDDLIAVTNRLTDAVNVLSAEYKKNNP